MMMALKNPPAYIDDSKKLRNAHIINNHPSYIGAARHHRRKS